MSYGAFKPAMANPADILAELQPPKAKPEPFTPGKPGKPKSGKSAHEIMRDPKVLRGLAGQIREHTAKHGEKALKGPDVKGMLHNVLGEVSNAQARTIARKLNKLMLQSTKA